MFWFTQEPSSGSQSQCLAKITGMVPQPHSRQNTDNALIDKNCGTILVILARHCLLLPDDGSCMNRNMLEQLLYF